MNALWLHSILILNVAAIEFTLLPKTFGQECCAPENTFFLSYNIEYDPIRERYVFINQFNADPANIPDIHEIDAQYAANTSMEDAGFIGTNYLLTSVIPNTGTTPFYYGSDIANDILYTVDVYGYLLAAELETENVINYIEFGNYPNNNTVTISSVCIDPDNTRTAYVPAANGDIYSVDVSSNTVGEWVINTIYSAGTAIQDQNGANPRTDFIGFDCTVYNNVMYVVEYPANASVTAGNLGIYDITTSTFTYNWNVLSEKARAITSTNGMLIIAQQSKATILYTYIPSSKTESMSPFQIITNIAQNDIGILEIAVDYDHGIVVMATYDSNLDGYLYFLQSDDFIPTTYMPTSSTGSPTMNPSGNPTLSPSDNPIRANVNDIGNNIDNKKDISLIIGVILLQLIILLRLL